MTAKIIKFAPHLSNRPTVSEPKTHTVKLTKTVRTIKLPPVKLTKTERTVNLTPVPLSKLTRTTRTLKFQIPRGVIKEPPK